MLSIKVTIYHHVIYQTILRGTLRLPTVLVTIATIIVLLIRAAFPLPRLVLSCHRPQEHFMLLAPSIQIHIIPMDADVIPSLPLSRRPSHSSFKPQILLSKRAAKC